MVAKGSTNRAGCDLFYYQAGCCGCICLGLLFTGMACGMGGCTCKTLCEGECTSWMGGCTKGDYDGYACTIHIMSNSNCDTAACKTGGLPIGAFFALLFLGIVFLIISCCLACGICGCGCFAGDPIRIEQTPVMVAALAAPFAPQMGPQYTHPPPPTAGAAT